MVRNSDLDVCNNEAFPRAISLRNKDLSALTQIATGQYLYLTIRIRKN